MKNFPKPVVGAVIFNPEGKVLICRAKKWNNKYIIPGGHIEIGEKIEDALQREIFEETGLHIYDITLISLKDNIPSKKHHNKQHFIFIDFICRTNTSEVMLNEEAQEYKWIDLQDIDNYDLCSFTKELLIQIRDSKKIGNKVNIFYN